MVKPVCNDTWVLFSSVYAACFTVGPRTSTSSVYREHCLVQLNIIPSGLIFTFLVTFSIHMLSKRVDISLPCLSPTTISKLGDFFPCFSGLYLLINFKSREGRSYIRAQSFSVLSMYFMMLQKTVTDEITLWNMQNSTETKIPNLS